MAEELNNFDEVQKAAERQRVTARNGLANPTEVQAKLAEKLIDRGCSPEFALSCAVREVGND